MAVSVRVMNGLGDAIYHRPYIRNLCKREEVILDTRWPLLFGDLDFDPTCQFDHDIRPSYDSKSLRFGNIPQAIEKFFPEHCRHPWVFDLPAFKCSPVGGKYAVIRPPTIRTDFYAPARNPDMKYIAEATEILKNNGITTVGVAACEPAKECLDGHAPPVDETFFDGRLASVSLMSLIEGASLVIGGPGWQVPASIAYKVPFLLIYGGALALNKPDRLIDERMGEVRYGAIWPDRPCYCADVLHHCDKIISNFEHKFYSALEELI